MSLPTNGRCSLNEQLTGSPTPANTANRQLGNCLCTITASCLLQLRACHIKLTLYVLPHAGEERPVDRVKKLRVPVFSDLFGSPAISRYNVILIVILYNLSDFSMLPSFIGHSQNSQFTQKLYCTENVILILTLLCEKEFIL